MSVEPTALQVRPRARLDALADEFVGMYVNDWTIDYGDRGREAVRRFLGEGAEKGFIDFKGDVEFVSP